MAAILYYFVALTSLLSIWILLIHLTRKYIHTRRLHLMQNSFSCQIKSSLWA